MKTSIPSRTPAFPAPGWLRWFILLFVLATLLLAPAAGAAKTYHAERFDADLAIQPGGALVVTETVAFRFEGGPFTYVYRDLAYTELDEIDRLQASMDGRPLPQGTGPGQVEIQAGRPLKVTWHFDPTSDATHTFTLVYRVRGAIRRLDGADALIWRAIPEEHDYRIAASAVTLRWPAGVAPSVPPVVRGPRAEIEAGAGLATIAAANIDEDQDLVIEARFPGGSLISAAPAWQTARAEDQAQVDRAWPLGAGAAALTTALGAGLLTWFWRRHPRPRNAPAARQMTRTEPPTAHPPALGVKLAGGSMPALAALFDLARRGVLRIDETPSRWGRKFVLHRQSGRDEGISPLRPHEQGLLAAMFGTKAGLAESIDLNKAGQQLAYRQRQFNEPLDAELLAAGLLDGARRARRQRLIVVTVIALVLGVLMAPAALLVGGALFSNRTWAGLPLAAIAVGIGAGLTLAGLAGILVAVSYPTRTAEGEEAAAAWRGFGDHLKKVAGGQAEFLRDADFEAYLPHAAGFGLAERWAKRYRKQADVPIPAWFSALSTDDGSAAFIAVMAATNSSVGSSSAGGAGGASGGGGSGAG